MKRFNVISDFSSRAADALSQSARTFFIILVALLGLEGQSLLAQYNGPSFLPNPVITVSTIPANGDVNPYGVAFVSPSVTPPPQALFAPGDLLVSNFNNSQNLQGTGTTIVRVTPSGQTSLFFEGPITHAGLSTALAVLREGLVVVGSAPTADGTCATAQAGALLVVSPYGQLLQAIPDEDIDVPWDMTVYNPGNGKFSAFVSNAGSGAVVRLDMAIQNGQVQILNKAVIGSYKHQCDPATLFDAPTGLVYDQNKDVLYVASTLDNAVFAISNALERNSSGGSGNPIYTDQNHLHGALAMAMAPDGHLLVSNNDVVNSDQNQPSEIVEFTTDGQFVKQVSVDPNLGGSFGLNVYPGQFSTRFAAVDDNRVSVSLWTVPTN
ncbi:MAG: hypothetical protein P4M04_03045 [Acidobacteriota bacterium]|nr:hypothetical protein [Acidobacteriota bacterium]